MTARLEDLKPDALVKGLVGREAVRIVTAEMLGEAAARWCTAGGRRPGRAAPVPRQGGRAGDGVRRPQVEL